MLRSSRKSAGATLAALAAAVSLAATALVAQAHAETATVLRIGGTGAALGGMQLLGSAFSKAHPGVQVVVLPSLGSRGGIRALLADKIDVAVSIGPFKHPGQDQQLVAWEYARTPLVFATHWDNSADGVTLEQLAQAYAGSLAAWPDGTRLRVVLRPAVEYDTMVIRGLSPETDKAVAAAMGRDLLVAITDQDNAAALEAIRGSLGMISLAQILSERRRLKPLALEGIEGTLQALRDGRYPHAKTMELITKPQPAPLVEAFLGFVRSPEGQRILASSGHLVTGANARPGM
jgi:phosphate transport system substrate-binding protein